MNIGLGFLEALQEDYENGHVKGQRPEEAFKSILRAVPSFAPLSLSSLEIATGDVLGRRIPISETPRWTGSRRFNRAVAWKRSDKILLDSGLSVNEKISFSDHPLVALL